MIVIKFQITDIETLFENLFYSSAVILYEHTSESFVFSKKIIETELFTNLLLVFSITFGVRLFIFIIPRI